MNNVNVRTTGAITGVSRQVTPGAWRQTGNKSVRSSPSAGAWPAWRHCRHQATWFTWHRLAPGTNWPQDNNWPSNVEWTITSTTVATRQNSFIEGHSSLSSSGQRQSERQSKSTGSTTDVNRLMWWNDRPWSIDVINLNATTIKTTYSDLSGIDVIDDRQRSTWTTSINHRSTINWPTGWINPLIWRLAPPGAWRLAQ